nr:hypothetical protein [Salinispora arenicola]
MPGGQFGVGVCDAPGERDEADGVDDDGVHDHEEQATVGGDAHDCEAKQRVVLEIEGSADHVGEDAVGGLRRIRFPAHVMGFRPDPSRRPGAGVEALLRLQEVGEQATAVCEHLAQRRSEQRDVDATLDVPPTGDVVAPVGCEFLRGPESHLHRRGHRCRQATHLPGDPHAGLASRSAGSRCPGHPG